MREKDIVVGDNYEVVMGRGKGIISVTGITESGSWLCTTTNGTTVKIGDPSRFLKRVKPVLGKGKKSATKSEPDNAPVASTKAVEGKAVQKADKPPVASTKASKGKVVQEAKPKAERPQKALKTSVITNTEPADPDTKTIERLRVEFKEAEQKSKVAQKSFAFGLIDQSKANEAHFAAEAAKLSFLKAGGKTHKGGRCTSQMSALSAAYRVLSESNRPMRAGEITDEAMNRGYWHSDASTPDATISSAIIMEMKRKGERSRFVKVGPGLFTVKD